MSPIFRCDLNSPLRPLPHFWEHTVGSDHAVTALRQDWREQLRRAHTELGFRHVRFHGLLSDDVCVLTGEGERLIYSFHNPDEIFDYLLSIGMRPFVELSFMPAALASGEKTVFHYKANVTPPKDYGAWATLIRKIVGHWVERYGAPEVRRWLFEVWNEPNLEFFGTGRQDDYFKLYDYTARAIKNVDAALQVGGPATAANAWIGDFVAYCRRSGAPLDFITTHHYPTDDFGKPGDDTVAQLAASRRSVLRDQARDVRRQAGDLPVYYTEWCTSSNARDPMHDEPYAAAFIVKTVMEANGIVQGYSYWTFSDIFEENYFPSMPFQGGFGLLTIHGVAKPAYRAFELLHALDGGLAAVDGKHPTVDCWVVRGENDAAALLTNWALPRHPIATETARVRLSGGPRPTAVAIRRIDADHANPKRLWQEMGSPEYPHAVEIEKLRAASLCNAEDLPWREAVGATDFEIVLPPLSVAAVTLSFEARADA